MQSKKVLDNVNVEGGDINNVTNSLMNNLVEEIPSNFVMLNRDLLPSKGKFYSNNLYVKKLSTLDIKNLSTINNQNANGIVNSVLSRCIKGISINDLLVGDKLWFIFYLRYFTYNNIPFNIKYTCDSCGNIGMFPMKLEDIECKYINDDFDDIFKTQGGDVIKYRFPTIGQEIQAQRLTKDQNVVENIDSQLIDIACYIDEVNGQHMSLYKAYEYLCNMDPIDFSNFGNTIADNIFGLNPTVNCKCECGNIVKERITFTSDFFMPKIK